MDSEPRQHPCLVANSQQTSRHCLVKLDALSRHTTTGQFPSTQGADSPCPRLERRREAHRKHALLVAHGPLGRGGLPAFPREGLQTACQHFPTTYSLAIAG